MKDGGPAFPQGDLSAYGIGPSDGMDGMSLRDWFAGQALAGIAEYGCAQPMKDGSPHKQAASVAALCFHIADAMLGARK